MARERRIQYDSGRMNDQSQPPPSLPTADTLYPKQVRRLRQIEIVVVAGGMGAVIVEHGLFHVTRALQWEMASAVVASMLFVTLSVAIRYGWSRARLTFVRNNRAAVVVSGLWVAGTVLILLFGPLLETNGWFSVSRGGAFVLLSELAIVLRGLLGVTTLARGASAGGGNPALPLVLSFASLISIGTILLMLPRARAQHGVPGDEAGAPFQVALFTATSASCVTGLIVEPTGTYWSELGQVVILCLFQIGGLGIMTFGAFFAVAAGRHMQIRESATLRDMMESERLGDVRRLVVTILVFTFSAELIGAVLISGLWADRPAGDQIFYSLFHSVSAFCNAGFSLTDNSFVGMGNRWQIWGVVTGLIVTGGIGFAVVYNMALVLGNRFKSRRRVRELTKPPLFNLPRERIRLTLNSKIVLFTTAVLLIVGTAGYYLLESTGPQTETRTPVRLCDAWFQSVTFRTAGFNTVDHQQLQSATKLLAVGLMFIGASPGSTGGGVKTTCFAIAVLAILSILRGRQRVEILGRTLPEDLVNRALTIISLGMMTMMTATLLLTLFEQQPERFLDHLFEAASAFGTVGVSANVTAHLSEPSRLVIVATMFLGRVGPLTLLIAMAGKAKEARYEFPLERVTLG